MRTWRKFKRLFTSCISPAMEESPVLADELNKGATLMIGSGQDTMLLLKDINTEEEVSSLFKQEIIRGRNSLKKIPVSLLAEVNVNPECSDELFMSFEERCPPGGQDCVVYTQRASTLSANLLTIAIRSASYYQISVSSSVKEIFQSIWGTEKIFGMLWDSTQMRPGYL